MGRVKNFSKVLSIEQNLRDLCRHYPTIVLAEMPEKKHIRIYSTANTFDEEFMYFLFEITAFFKSYWEINLWYNKDIQKTEFLITERQ